MNVYMVKHEYYTVQEVADLLHVNWQTVLNYIKAGKLKALRLGKGYRISQTALNQFLKKNETKGTKKWKELHYTLVLAQQNKKMKKLLNLKSIKWNSESKTMATFLVPNTFL